MLLTKNTTVLLCALNLNNAEKTKAIGMMSYSILLEQVINKCCIFALVSSLSQMAMN